MNYEPRLHVVLVNPEIPQNTGNIGRTCVAVGAKLWLVRPLGFRLDDHYLRRAGLDYWHHLEWEIVDRWSSLRKFLPVDKAWYFSKTATRSYVSAKIQPNDVLVFGCETDGLPSELINKHPEQLLRIPMRREARSLNLANAVSVAVYEAMRQIDLLW